MMSTLGDKSAATKADDDGVVKQEDAKKDAAEAAVKQEDAAAAEAATKQEDDAEALIDRKQEDDAAPTAITTTASTAADAAPVAPLLKPQPKNEEPPKQQEQPIAYQKPHTFHQHRTWSESIFPMKLYDILCNPQFSHAISWMPHGRSWKVLNKEYFMEEICPQYFAQTRYESFIRQVNGWGFKRLRREGPDRSTYYHECFLRGCPQLMEGMKRPNPGEKVRDTAEEEPNFYTMPPLPLLPPRPMGSLPIKGGNGKVGRPPSAANSGRSSFDAVPPRNEFMGPYPPGQPFWAPPPGYYPYPPPHGYFPPPLSPWRGPPPHGPPHGYPYPPPGSMPLGYPYPPPYDSYGHPPSPIHRPRSDSMTQTPKHHQEYAEEPSPKRMHVMNPPHMGYYYPPGMYEEIPKKEEE